MKLLKLPLILLFFLLVVLCLAGALVIGVAVLNSPGGAVPEEGVLFQVMRGEASEHVFLRLEEGRLVRSAFLLRVIAKLSETESALKAGVYRIKPGHTAFDIHNLLVSGKQEMKRVTVKEGWTLGQIAGLLEREGLMPAGEFLKAARSTELLSRYKITGRTAEGFLFPETYYFPYEVKAPEVMATMIDTFFAKLAVVYPAFRELDAQAFYRKVILASIVEREYRNEREAPAIASVFVNRLEADMRLESCATVAYVLTEQKGRAHPERLTWADLAVPSPYNTYLHAGLPPGPIGNPGATALIAAFMPMKSSYRFFVLKDPASGAHEFSNTFREHLAAKELYIKKY